MDYKALWKRWQDLLLPGLCLAALFLVAGMGFDYYYDLNDDVLIKDILAGVYTGTPELLNPQQLAPLSAVLAFLYRLLPGVPVYGIFLWLCQAGSLYCILYRSMRFAASSLGKLGLCVLETLAVGCMLFYHLVFVQYTVAGGLLMAAAVFWFLTSGKAAGEDQGGTAQDQAKPQLPAPGAFLWQNLPAVLLAVLAFLLRSEMMLLLFPLAAVAGIWKWFGERPVFTRRNFACYAGLFGLILAGLVLAWLTDKAAFGSPGWKEFCRLFDARTEVYDFKSEGLRSYEENREFYDSLGLSEARCELLANYNYGASDQIDADIMEKISEYGRKQEGYFVHSLREGLWLYLERLKNNRSLGFSELPFLLIEAVLVVCLLLAALRGRKSGLIWRLLLFGGVRSALWMYLILRERVPERISHPLYFMEILALGWLLLSVWEKERRIWAGEGKRRLPAFPVGIAAAALLLVICVASLPEEWNRTAEEYAKREQVNALDQAARSYYLAHSDCLYLADVESTVAFSQKLFARDDGFGNYDLLGGWLCKSPLMEKKLARFGYASMEEAVTEGENVYLVGEPEADWSWMEALLAEKGVHASLAMEETISAQGGELYVWRLVRK